MEDIPVLTIPSELLHPTGNHSRDQCRPGSIDTIPGQGALLRSSGSSSGPVGCPKSGSCLHNAA